MFNIQKVSENEFNFVGVIDDSANFSALAELHLSKVGPEIRLNCRQVSRINSIGIKEWRIVIEKLRSSGKKLTFSEVSSILIEQVNYIKGFIATSEISSFCLPYVCEKCGKSHYEVMSTEQAKKTDPDNRVPKPKCQGCGNEMIFDEMPEAYLAFLSHK